MVAGDFETRCRVASVHDATDDRTYDLSSWREHCDVGVCSHGKRAFLFFDAEYLRGIDGCHPNCVL